MGHIGVESFVDDVTKVGPIGSNFISTLLYENVNLHPILHYHRTEAFGDGKYSNLAVMNSSKVGYYITPEEISNKLHIGLNTAARTFKDTTSQFI